MGHVAKQSARFDIAQLPGPEQGHSGAGKGSRFIVTLPLAVPFAATGSDIAWLALLGLVQLAIPCALAVVCARSLKAPEVSLLALLEVIFGILLAWLGAGEAPGAEVLTGGSLVIGALVLNELLGWRSRAATPRIQTVDKQPQ